MHMRTAQPSVYLVAVNGVQLVALAQVPHLERRVVRGRQEEVARRVKLDAAPEMKRDVKKITISLQMIQHKIVRAPIDGALVCLIVLQQLVRAHIKQLDGVVS